MKRNLNTMLMCAAVSLSVSLAGCQKDDTTVVKAAAPPPSADATGGGKPAAGGAVFSPTNNPAPTGMKTGNYQGGKKE